MAQLVQLPMATETNENIRLAKLSTCQLTPPNYIVNTVVNKYIKIV